MRIVFLGDSLISGIGADKGWIAQLDELVNSSGQRHKLINKGIAGDTSGGMLARFGRDVVELKPTMVFLLGGGNDFIAGAGVEVVRANIFALTHQAWNAKIAPIVCSPILPDFDSLREDWKDFAEFTSITKKMNEQRKWLEKFGAQFSTSIIDFETEFLATLKAQGKDNINRSEYFSDGLHPNDKGQEIMAQIVLDKGIIY